MKSSGRITWISFQSSVVSLSWSVSFASSSPVYPPPLLRSHPYPHISIFGAMWLKTCLVFQATSLLTFTVHTLKKPKTNKPKNKCNHTITQPRNHLWISTWSMRVVEINFVCRFMHIFILVAGRIKLCVWQIFILYKDLFIFLKHESFVKEP